MNDERTCSRCKAFSSKFIFFKDFAKIDCYRPGCKFCTNQYHSRKREKRNLRERKR